MSSPKHTQMNGQDDDLLADWVVVDHLDAPVVEETEEEVENDKEEEEGKEEGKEEEEGMATRLEEVLTLREDHFRPLEDGQSGFVSLSDLYSPVGGYESGWSDDEEEDRDEFDEFLDDLRLFFIDDIDPNFDYDNFDPDGDDAFLPTDLEFHLLELWNAVTQLGGYQQVTSNFLWGQIGDSLGLPSAVTETLQGWYEKILLRYEMYKFGNMNGDAANEDQAVPLSTAPAEVPAPAPADQTQEQNGTAGSQVPAEPESSSAATGNQKPV